MRDFEDYERDGPRIDALYPGVCAIDKRHKYKKRDTIAKVKLKENPFIPIPGYACASCVILMK